MPSIALRRSLASLLCILFLAAEAGAAAGDMFTGTWAIDIPATVPLVAEKSREPHDDLENLLEAIGHMTVTFDLKNRDLIYRLTGMPAAETFEKIEEISSITRIKEKSPDTFLVYLNGNRNPIEAFFLPDGRMRLDNELMLIRLR